MRLRRSALQQSGRLEGAAEHLEQLSQRSGATLLVRLQLARLLVSLQRDDAARPIIQSLDAERSALTPKQSMVLAHLHDGVGDPRTALTRAFEAYRRDDADPHLHKGLATLALRLRLSEDPPTVVGAETYVRLVDDRGASREYAIVPDPPANPHAHEILLDDAARLDLVGRRVGEVIVLNSGSWQERRWRVESIQSTIYHAVQDILANFEARFPGEPFFVAGFSMGDAPSVASFAPLIQSLAERRKKTEELFAIHAEKVLPSGGSGGEPP